MIASACCSYAKIKVIAKGKCFLVVQSIFFSVGINGQVNLTGFPTGMQHVENLINLITKCLFIHPTITFCSEGKLLFYLYNSSLSQVPYFFSRYFCPLPLNKEPGL